MITQLTERITKLMESNDLPKSAFIIDDEWGQQNTPSLAAWNAFKQAISAEPESYANFSMQLKEAGHDQDSPLSADVLDKIYSAISIISPLMRSEKEKYLGEKRSLTEAETILKSLAFDVKPFSAAPIFQEVGIPSLLLIDFHLSDSEFEGETATEIFAAIMTISRERKVPPPFVILMSKKLLRTEMGIVLKLAQDSGFFRFNYDFVPKSEISQNPVHLYFAILRLFGHAAASKAYFEQLVQLERETQKIATETAKRFFQITPAEIDIFRLRLENEGSDVPRALTKLFSEHVSAIVSNSPSIRQCFDGVDNAFSSHKSPIWDIGDHGPLFRLYSEILFSPVSATEVKSHPQFGDVYHTQNGQYFLVISQECDLARGAGKTPNILVITGRRTSQPPPRGQVDGETSTAFPLSDPETGSLVWITWIIKEPMTVKRQELFQNGDDSIADAADPSISRESTYKKKFRFRVIEAEYIQQLFASRLTRVGMDIIPNAITYFSASVKHTPQELGYTVEACCVKDSDDKWRVALLRPTQLLTAVPNLSFEMMCKLGAFLKLAEFTDVLKEIGLTARSEDDAKDLILGVKGRTSDPWHGFPLWTGPR